MREASREGGNYFFFPNEGGEEERHHQKESEHPSQDGARKNGVTGKNQKKSIKGGGEPLPDHPF